MKKITMCVPDDQAPVIIGLVADLVSSLTLEAVDAPPPAELTARVAGPPSPAFTPPAKRQKAVRVHLNPSTRGYMAVMRIIGDTPHDVFTYDHAESYMADAGMSSSTVSPVLSLAAKAGLLAREERGRYRATEKGRRACASYKAPERFARAASWDAELETLLTE